MQEGLRDGRARSVAALGEALDEALGMVPGVAPERAAPVLALLDARYGEPHRAYHTLAHVDQVLGDVDALVAAGEPVADLPAVRLAAWFHDAVYDPRAGAGENEAASARLAGDALAPLGVAPDRVARVAALVLATADHVAATADERVLCDADLAVLAGDPADYDAYARAIRVEYARVPDDRYRAGRAAVLTRLLGRERIYATATLRERGEAAARRNLGAELARLRAGHVPPAAGE